MAAGHLFALARYAIPDYLRDQFATEGTARPAAGTKRNSISHRGHGGHGEEKRLENNIFSVSSVTSVAICFLKICAACESFDR